MDLCTSAIGIEMAVFKHLITSFFFIKLAETLYLLDREGNWSISEKTLKAQEKSTLGTLLT